MASRDDGRRADDLAEEARQLEASGDRASALERWSAALALERTPEILLRLGRLVRLTGNHQEAEILLREAVDIDPQDSQARFQLGCLYDAQGRLDEARFELETSVALDEWEPAWTVLGNVYRRLELQADSRRACARATELDPTNSEAWYGLGLTYRVEAPAKARELFERAIAEDACDAAAHRERGNMLWQTGDLEQAEESVRTALRLNDADALAHAYLGNLLMLADDEAKTIAAEAEFRRAIALVSDYPLYHCNLGDALGRQGRFDEAHGCYAAALAMDVSYYLPNLRMGQLLIEKGRLTSARRYLQRTLELKPDERRARAALERISCRPAGK